MMPQELSGLPARTTCGFFSSLPLFTGRDVVLRFVLLEQEDIMDFDDHLDAIVAALYLAHFGGAPDYQTNQHYLELFLTLIEQGGDDPAALPEAGKALSEIMFKDSGGDGLVSTNEAFVTLLYQRILGRAPDPEGLAYWTHELDSQITSRGHGLAHHHRRQCIHCDGHRHPGQRPHQPRHHGFG